jgi:hypothetical protein
VEDLAFEFPPRTYGGHFTELGFNAVCLDHVAHCWVKNIHIVNADSGIMASSVFCTMQGVTYRSDSVQPGRGNVSGHHGIYLGGHDNLFTEFDFGLRFIHDISVSHTAGNVISDGKGIDLCFDHHKRAPFENLFTNIDAGKGTRLWKCGGGNDLGRHAGARETFWNIRAQASQSHPGDFGPASMNLVGLQTDWPTKTSAGGIWFEAIPPSELQPQNLHRAQRERRLGALQD